MATTDSEGPPFPGAVFGLARPKTPAKANSPTKASKKKSPTAQKVGRTPRAALKDTAGAGARRKRRNKRQKGMTDELQVTAQHLECFSNLHALLLVFNDPYASGFDLAKHVEEIPILAARLVRSARIQTGHLDLTNINTALSFLGNKGLEGELLNLLEDMTVAKADLEDEEAPK